MGRVRSVRCLGWRFRGRDRAALVSLGRKTVRRAVSGPVAMQRRPAHAHRGGGLAEATSPAQQVLRLTPARVLADGAGLAQFMSPRSAHRDCAPLPGAPGRDITGAGVRAARAAASFDHVVTISQDQWETMPLVDRSTTGATGREPPPCAAASPPTTVLARGGQAVTVCRTTREIVHVPAASRARLSVRPRTS